MLSSLLSWLWRQRLAVGLLLLSQKLSAAADEPLIGSLVTCMEDGPYTHPITASNPCISCYCKSGIVNCEYVQDCPSSDGCHNLLTGASAKAISPCCPKVCLGCTYNNITIRSGETFQDENSCISLQCHGGVLTKSRDVCYAPCKNPKRIAGKCCPVCEGCVYKNKVYSEGLQFADNKDPCVRCQCKNGAVSCIKRSCPQLNCPPGSVQQPARGECCSTCGGSRQTFRIKNSCLYHPLNMLFRDGSNITQPDNCQSCYCEKGSVICQKETCPRYKCRESELLPPAEGECCPKCPPPKKKCKLDGEKIKHGKVWFKSQCTKCTCLDGSTHCWTKDCSSVIINCPKKTHELQYIGGLCCPQCVETNDDTGFIPCFIFQPLALCFGDPHYRTFDGFLYTFQGTCQYTLAEQCDPAKRTFSIQVKNSEWPDKTQYAFTESVLIVTKHLEIELQQELQVKVNTEIVTLPYIKLGHVSIIQKGYSLAVSISLGVSLIWDGNSYVEVSVPQRYKNKMCGLCGNYNGVSEDDLTGRNNVNFSNPDDFGKSWQRGISNCATPLSIYTNQLPMSSCLHTNTETLTWIDNKCEELKRHVVMSYCRTMIRDISIYYNSDQCAEKLCFCRDPTLCYCKLALQLLRACQPLERSTIFRDEITAYCGIGAYTNRIF
ncbi:cv-2 [Bugula neritina]|uniref:Cv-2 n=1 Tax=Bugula neritina TaxID=10212 RepID=A0A7J7J4M3_BUGNE|nr:cv-2 [Bugula neritina]